MARPSTFPFWATQSEVDSEYGTANKIVPTQEKQDFGQRGKKNTLRQDINYLFNTICNWLIFFDNQLDINDVYFVDGTTTAVATINERLGGTWDFIDSVNGEVTLITANDSQAFIKIGY